MGGRAESRKGARGAGRRPLHPLEFRILLVLLGGPTHGYRIVKQIEERDAGGGKIYPANLYRRIRDLLERGLIEEAPPPAGESRDPRRTYLRVSAAGRRAAEVEARRVEALAAEVRQSRLLENS